MRILVIISTFIISISSLADVLKSESDLNLPKYEFGLSLAHLSFPNYPGAKGQENLTLPLPFFFYRGDLLRSDEDGGIRGRILDYDRFEINFSISGAPPASSDDIEIREGMDDLPFILELGPRLIYKIILPSINHNWRLNFYLPFRVPIAFDGIRTDDRGLIINPSVFGFYNIIPKKLKAFFRLSYRWGNEEFNQTYYQVNQSNVTGLRNRYDARSGSVSVSSGIGFNYKFNKDITITSAFFFEDLSGNANKGSPLFEKEENYFFFTALSWTLFKSKKKQGEK